MFSKIKSWLLTDKAGAITNGTAAVIWLVLAATSKEVVFHWLGGINTFCFAALAGMKLADHMTAPRIRMLQDALDGQHRLIMALAEARQEEKDEYDDMEVS